ncbi:hypothetical protein [Bacillus sp. FJAT-44742]|uniref:hypothetical protein n=1 Tax=Bacillus sp. FJAT-44742 TaxID=2014005 RepID=UPI000C230708|nr:hypothetical protein [Bacillus sp. FJAT-44742]
MSRRKKQYQQGERATIYINRDVSPEMLEWINKQSDLSNFFLYAAKELYKQTGNMDVAEILPRKINFSLDETAAASEHNSSFSNLRYFPSYEEKEPPEKKLPILLDEDEEEQEKAYEEEVEEEESDGQDESWSNLEMDDDDPFA